ncbi:asparagine synthetase B family protein [Chitinophaga sancti]|uniref:asparagine synthase (glutamine-hydrolyzing) n=1 Tax=Chitinophaga sancti TaxID=1004 RepID=A0A1K1M7G1_9BACT|nr:asparagine synthase-related protein [Chitinophaga sancti]WQD64578.1 asparagine synthase-related protein [Chitinophaga sancti]WQG89798.1 asparagine synthase-related protein [Chitinophaga sancti]SFW19092.1 asparagine synthase (glutamine-hydrolysing) [Chitinophaga sancti]
MSAIFGIINKSRKPLDPVIIPQIRNVLHHRAIDGMDVWTNQYIALAHFKLAMNVSELQQQVPLETEDLVITADIRLDNRHSLLQKTGAPAQCSDLVLLQHAWNKWKEACVAHLEGEFAICIWDKTRQQCFLATDHIGFRTLYYYDSPEVFIFCSEQKGVEAFKPTPARFNEVSLIEYYFRQSCPAATYDADVWNLCGGNTLILANGIMSIRKYWEPAGGRYKFRKDEDWYECLKALLYEAVSNRLNTDKPIGITLSGGLDSSAVACVLADVLQKKNKALHAFSAILPEKHHPEEEDERYYIDVIGRHCPNLIQTYITANAYGPFDGIVAAFERDETFPNVFYYMDHAILEAAKEHQVGVLYTGFGGDHWVSWKGNPVIYNLVKSGRLLGAWKLVKQFADREGKRIAAVIKREIMTQSAKRSVTTTAEAPFLQDLFFQKYSKGLSFGSVSDITAHMCDNLRNGRTGLFPALLAKRNERFGMQSAVPLLDKQIMEFMIDIPMHLFVKGGYKRSLIRHTMEGIVPPEVLWRKDKGMYSPDYISRIHKERAYIRDIANSDKHLLAFQRYLTRDGLTLNDTNRKDVAILRTNQSVIASEVLTELSQKGYIIP